MSGPNMNVLGQMVCELELKTGPKLKGNKGNTMLTIATHGWSMLLSFSTLNYAYTRPSPLAEHLKRFKIAIFIFGPRSKRGSQDPLPSPTPQLIPILFFILYSYKKNIFKGPDTLSR